LETAEEAINDTQNKLTKEKEKRLKLVKELEDKTKQLNDILEQESKSLHDKV